MLTGRYLNGIPADSRAGHDPRFLKPDAITADKLERIRKLDALAKDRGQSLAQMALAWVLRQPGITSALIGASKVSQIDDNLGALKNLKFGSDELKAIDAILA
jgi:L-glyceraldehyde 3-phosphate reductase